MGLFKQLLVSSLALLASAAALPSGSNGRRQIPVDATGVKTITSPNGVTIRYKEPGSEGICETTPGVNSYSGYIDLSPTSHTFFWFVEARNSPETAPLTLWLNGGPGSDSLIGFFQELGPCNVTANLTTQLNPYAWNEVSNMLFLSQPLGTGFSYSEEGVGIINNFTGDFQNQSEAGYANGRYPVIDASKIDTTNLAAIACWEILQGFLSNLPTLDEDVESKVFNLATESYGGHYGPAFFSTFQEQNALIANGSASGTKLTFNSLTIINGIIDEAIQAPHYPEFAVNNTYGIKAYNDSIYEYTQIALYMPNGCLEQVTFCRDTNMSTPVEQAICSEAQSMCRDNVEGAYYNFGGRGVYDIRHPINDPTPPSYFEHYLNLAAVQNALGVNLNYTTSNTETYYSFQQTGDFVYNYFKADLESILDSGVQVSMIYGDADYICNWFGGEAVSLALEYKNADAFRAAGYAPFLVDGVEYGETREHGNFSFTRIYEAGHEVPYYQPIAALAAFNRTINHFIVSTGAEKITANFSTVGNATATHTNSFVPLPTATGGSARRA